MERTMLAVGAVRADRLRDGARLPAASAVLRRDHRRPRASRPAEGRLGTRRPAGTRPAARRGRRSIPSSSPRSRSPSARTSACAASRRPRPCAATSPAPCPAAGWRPVAPARTTAGPPGGGTCETLHGRGGRKDPRDRRRRDRPGHVRGPRRGAGVSRSASSPPTTSRRR